VRNEHATMGHVKGLDRQSVKEGSCGGRAGAVATYDLHNGD
jgi:hypothetical protein